MTKRSIFKRAASILLALVLVFSAGVWYVYPVVENANHSTLLGSKTESYIDLYMNQIDIVNAK